MQLIDSFTQTATSTPTALTEVKKASGAILDQLAIVIQADPDNTGTVSIGDANSQDFELSASAGITLFVLNTNEIFISGNDSDTVNVLVQG